MTHSTSNWMGTAVRLRDTWMGMLLLLTVALGVSPAVTQAQSDSTPLGVTVELSHPTINVANQDSFHITVRDIPASIKTLRYEIDSFFKKRGAAVSVEGSSVTVNLKDTIAQFPESEHQVTYRVWLADSADVETLVAEERIYLIIRLPGVDVDPDILVISGVKETSDGWATRYSSIGFRGKGTRGATVGVTVGDNTRTDDPGELGNWSATAVGLVEGDNYVYLQAFDPAGNFGTRHEIGPIRLDTVAPEVLTSAVVGDPPATATAVTFEMKVSEPVSWSNVYARLPFQLYATGDAQGTVQNVVLLEDRVTFRVEVDGISGTGALRLDLLERYAFIFDHVDNKVSADFTSGTFHNVDTVAPMLTQVLVDQPVVNRSNQSSMAITLDGVTEAATAHISIADGTGTPLQLSGLVTAENPSVTGLDVSSLADGVLQVEVYLQDAVGNQSAGSATTVNKKTSLPTLAAVTASAGHFREGHVIHITLTASESLVVSNAQDIQLPFQLGSTQRAATLVSAADEVLTFAYTVQAGDNTGDEGVIVPASASALVLNSGSITDAAGNPADLAFAGAIYPATQVDTEAPVIAGVVFDVAWVNAANQQAISLTLQGVSEAATYQYAINSSAGGVAVSGTGVASAGDSVLNAIDVSGLVDGTLSVVVTINDVAGNVSAPVTATIEKDTVAPAAPGVPLLDPAHDSGISAADNITRINAPRLSGSAEPGSVVALMSDSTPSGTTHADTSGSWTMVTPAMADGLHQFTVTATDAAGNVSDTSDALVLTVDTTAPTLAGAGFDASLIDSTNYRNVRFSLQGAEVGAAAVYTITSSGGGTPVSGAFAVAALDQTVSGLDLSALRDGTVTLAVTLTDVAGNESSATATVIKDVNPELRLPKGPGHIVDGSQHALTGAHVVATTISTLTVTLSMDEGQGVLHVGAAPGLTVEGNGSAVITLNGTESAINTALAALSYTAPVNFAAQGADAVRIRMSVGDGHGQVSGQVVIHVHDRPDLHNVEGAGVAWSAGEEPVVIHNGGVSISDLDSPHFDGGSLAVVLLIGGQYDQDVLSFRQGGAVRLDGSGAGSRVNLREGDQEIVVGTLEHAIQPGHTLMVNLNNEATPQRVARLLNEVTYNNVASQPVSGIRTLGIEVHDGSHPEAQAGARTTVAVNMPPEAPEEVVIGGRQTDVDLDGDIRITEQGVIHGGRLAGTIHNAGLISGNVTLAPGSHLINEGGRITGHLTLGANVTVTGGRIDGAVTGDSRQPARIAGADLGAGATLSHVVIDGTSSVDPAATLEAGVRFESNGNIPAGIDLSEAVGFLPWIAGDRPAVDLGQDVLVNGPAILEGIRSLPELTGTGLEQNSQTGELELIAADYAAHVLPVRITQAPADVTPGLYFTDDGEVLFVTETGRAIVAHPVVVGKEAFRALLEEQELTLEFDERGNLRGTHPELDFFFSVRPDLIALPAHRHNQVGLFEFPLAGLGSEMGMSFVFDHASALFEQDLVPASPDWPALRAALLAIEGLSEVRIDTQGIIHVVLDGQPVRARLDYRVFTAVEAEAEQASLRAVGDRSGNGQPDFDMIYPNGDVQALYLF